MKKNICLFVILYYPIPFFCSGAICIKYLHHMGEYGN